MEENIEMLQKEVSAILLRDWDPFGASDLPGASEEYDGYAAEIIAMHQNGALSAESLYEFLKGTTERKLDMKADEESIARTVTNIVTILKQ